MEKSCPNFSYYPVLCLLWHYLQPSTFALSIAIKAANCLLHISINFCYITVKLKTLGKPDLKKFDERNINEMLVKALIFVYVVRLFCLVALLKFGDLTPICQIRQSFNSSTFLIYSSLLLQNNNIFLLINTSSFTKHHY